MEKLFVQIFERKNWIIDQLRQQSDLYNQHLASKLLIEGVPLPQWLWQPDPLSGHTDSRELSKEEMISKLLFPHPNHAFPCSAGLYSLHNGFVVSGENIPLPKVLASQVHAPKKSFGDVQEKIPFAAVLDMSPQEKIPFAAVLDMSPPQEKISLSNPDSCMWADKSLVQVERSKSRQRAFELRSASKRAADKSSTHQEKDSKWQEDLSSLKKSTSIEFSDRVTRSKLSRDLLNHTEESVEINDSFKISKKGDDQWVDSTIVCPGKEVSRHPGSLDLTVNKRRKSRSGAWEKSPLVNNAMRNESQKLSNVVDKYAFDKENKNADSVDYEPHQHQVNCMNFELNSIDPVVASENIILNVPSDCGVLMKPMTLDSSEVEKIKSSELSAVIVDKEPLDRMAGRICNSSEKPSESLVITGVDYCDTWQLEGRSLQLEVSNKVDTVQESNFNHPKLVHLLGQSSEPKCQSSGLKIVKDVDDMSLSVPNIHHPSSDEIKSVSINDCCGKIASPLPGKEKIDTTVDKKSILSETKNRSPMQSNFNNPKTWHFRGKSSEQKCQSSGSEVDESQQGLNISSTEFVPASRGKENMVIGDVPDSEMQQSLKKHFTEGCNSSPKVQSDEVENSYFREDQSEMATLTFLETENSSSLSSLMIQPTGAEMGLEDPNVDTFNYKGGSHKHDVLNKGMTDLASREIIMKDKFNLHESVSFDCGLVNGKDVYFGTSSLVEEFDKSCSHRGVMFTNNSYPQHKRRKIEGEKKISLSALTNVLVKENHNVTLHPVNVETSLKVSSHVSCDGETTHMEIDGNPEVEMHHKLICHLTAGSNLPLMLQDEIDTKDGDTDTDSSSFIRMNFLQGSNLKKQRHSDSKGAVFSYMEIGDPPNLAFDVRKPFNVDTNSEPYMEHGTNVSNNSTLTYLDGPLPELEDLLEEYGLHSSSSAEYTDMKDLESVGTNCIMPEFEGFSIDSGTGNEQLHLDGDMIYFDDINLQNTIERASYLEQLCLSSSKHTSVPPCSIAFMIPKTPDLYKCVPNGPLEQMNLGSSVLEIDDMSKQNRASHSYTQEGKNKNQDTASSHHLLFSDSQFGWSSKQSFLPSGENLWDHMDLIPSKSGSSEKHRSSNPEFACFRIEEDDSEECDNVDGIPKEVQENPIYELVHSGDIREALTEMTESQINGLVQIAAVEDKCPDKNSLCSQPSFTRQNPANRYRNRHPSEGKENCTLSVEVNHKKRAESSNNRFSKPKLSSKGSERQGRHRPSDKLSKSGNIVSNITSFVPLVQQKQAAAVCPGKRDIKVRALETAEAAKRLEEKKNNERNMKKEALKLERERLARENMKQTELLKKKKEEELKKKDADIAARKRKKEEEEKNVNERKRRHIEQARQQQPKEQEVKLHAKKGQKEIRPTTTDGKMNRQESNDRLLEHQNMDNEAPCKTLDAQEVTSDSVNTTGSNIKSPEKSYDMSPYQNSDDEDEDVEPAATKFIPSWASKKSLDIALSLMTRIDADVIFPPDKCPTKVNKGRCSLLNIRNVI